MAPPRNQRGDRRSPPYRAAAICAPGLEPLLADELTDLGCRPKPAGAGTVEFAATARQLYRANVWLRVAGRVTVRASTFRATDFDHLERGAAEIAWAEWLAPGTVPRFRVSATASKLYHTEAVAERLAAVAAEATGADPLDGGDRVESDDDGQLVVVRIDRNTVTISIDSSGAPLHHRPWRTDLGPAPLRATMAAAVLRAVGWRPGTPLLDPFCGSGVIPIEAALIARRLPPGGEREFAFHRWPRFEPGTWASVAGEIAEAEPVDEAAPILASDRDAEAVAATIGNAAAAGVGDRIDVETRVVSHLAARSDAGLVVTNPPYGRRVGDGDVRPLYRRFGAVVRDRLPGWGLAMIAADRKLAAVADRRLAPVARFRHGGIPVQVVTRPSASEDDLVADRAGEDDPGLSVPPGVDP